MGGRGIEKREREKSDNEIEIEKKVMMKQR